MNDSMPREIWRRRRLFAFLRDEVERLHSDEANLPGMSEGEMLTALTSIERTLEYTEVWRNARAWCEQVEEEARTGLVPDRP